MEFPITDLLDQDQCEAWLLAHFHPEGLCCPKCGTSVEEASVFRTTRRSHLTTWRCRRCRHAYNLYSGTVFQKRHLTPMQVVLFVRGVVKGESGKTLSAELGITYSIVLELRRALQANAEMMQAHTALKDTETESDEMFQNAGEKRRVSLRP